MTRVLFLAERVFLGDDSLPPHGSAAHATASLAALRRGFEVLPLTGGEVRETAARLGSLRAAVPRRVRGARQDLMTLRAGDVFAARAEAALRDFGPDVVYERNEYLLRAGTRLCERHRLPLVLEVNGLVDDEMRTMYRSLLEPYGARLERIKLRRAAAIVVESPGMAEALAARGAPADRLAIVPNAVPPSRLRDVPRVANPARGAIAWMGHLMPWHVEALELLLSVGPAIAREDERVHFDIFGGGPAMAEIAARAPSSFAFHGVVPYEQLPARLESVDIALVPDMPPHKLPVKIVEFGAAGLPLVAPRSDSLDRQLEPFVEYQPFRRRDRDSLAEAVLAVVRDGELRSRLAANLHAAVRERYTWDVTAPKLQGVVERVLGER